VTAFTAPLDEARLLKLRDYFPYFRRHSSAFSSMLHQGMNTLPVYENFYTIQNARLLQAFRIPVESFVG
jgi:hypothetical protein